MTEPQIGGTYEELLALARWAETAELDAFARSDHYLNLEESAPATDAFATLAGLARDTERIRLTILVAPITFRHPAVIAKTAATIDQMSGGRFELGIGTGWMPHEHEALSMEFPPLRDRFSYLFETLAFVRTAFGRDGLGYRGRHFHLAEIDVLPRPTGPLPIIVGGHGAEKTPMMAGRFADEYNLMGPAVANAEARIAAMRQAARDAYRDPDEVKVSMMTPALIGEDEAEFRDLLGEAAADLDIDTDAYATHLRDRKSPVGTADQARAILEQHQRAGISRIYVQEMRPLSAIDTSRLDRAIRALRG